MDGGIADWIARRAQRRPGAVALVDVATGARLTYADLDRRVGARAAALAALGIEAGARVALLGENSAAYLEWLFGAARLGAITVPINHRLSPGEVAHVLTDSGAAVLVRSTAFTGLAGDALDVAGSLPVVELGEQPGDGVVDARPVAGDDPCVIMYTSGTTGVPKGAVLTHDNMLWNAINMAVAGPGIGGTDITVAAAPLFHIGALGLSALPLLYAGGTVVVVPSFDPAAFVELMAREGVTTQFLVPAMWAALTRLDVPAPAARAALGDLGRGAVPRDRHRALHRARVDVHRGLRDDRALARRALPRRRRRAHPRRLGRAAVHARGRAAGVGDRR